MTSHPEAPQQLPGSSEDPTVPARRRTRRLVAIPLVLLLLAGVLVALAIRRSDPPHRPVAAPPTSSAAASAPVYRTSEGPPVPSSGAYLGAWVYPQPFSQDGRVQSVDRFQAAIGGPLRIVHLYRKWDQDVGTASDLAFAQRGQYLLLSWATPDLNQVISGSQDALISRRAQQIASLPTQVYLEIRWEMDRAGLASVVHGPATYIAAWQHIQNIFRAQHVSNVGWTWCPTAGGFDDGTAPAYYPGDSRVDWVCADVYPKTPWLANDYESFPMLAGNFMSWAAKHDKPVIIGEFAAAASYGARRPQWIAEAANYVRAHPQIKAVAWFDQTQPSDPKYYSFGLQSDPAALSAFSELTQSRYFRASPR